MRGIPRLQICVAHLRPRQVCVLHHLLRIFEVLRRCPLLFLDLLLDLREDRLLDRPVDRLVAPHPALLSNPSMFQQLRRWFLIQVQEALLVSVLWCLG